MNKAQKLTSEFQKSKLKNPFTWVGFRIKIYLILVKEYHY
jgi:pyridoxine/pyridoxamine 5'-phosphate oxidase